MPEASPALRFPTGGNTRKKRRQEDWSTKEDPCCAGKKGSFHQISIFNEDGDLVDISYYDVNEHPCEDVNGFAHVVFPEGSNRNFSNMRQYDKNGNEITEGGKSD
jgi:hypothetical protein